MFVPENKIIPLAMSVEDGMKMIISGGLYTPPHLKEAKQHKGTSPFSNIKTPDSEETEIKV